VLKGDMSLVGPRPLLMQYLKRYTPEQARRHEVRPGITGWAQVNNRKLKFAIGDVRRPESLPDAMTGVDFVFHAAALKQAPSCKFYPMEALLTNSLGAENER
jgi:FlaA1/EpsC-like NDP-sugar epimerase